MNDKPILPLTWAEERGNKHPHIVRAAARIAVVMQHPDGERCLFVRHHTKGLELPGGAIEPCEEPAQASLRELAEEAGIQLPLEHPLTLIMMIPIIDDRGGYWLDIIYRARVTSFERIIQGEAELAIHWLREEEIEGQVDQQLSSYSAALTALHLSP